MGKYRCIVGTNVVVGVDTVEAVHEKGMHGDEK